MVFDSMPLLSKKVCVIGAGMSGLAAARELRREGHGVTVLEQSSGVGGQWLYDPRTDGADPLGAAEAPVKVHSSMYASLRLISARETTGFTDFPFAPKNGDLGRDHRRFPGHPEVYLYLRDFCDAFGLMDAVRLNTKVLRVAMAPMRQWAVRSIGLGECDGDEKAEVAVVEEVFDAVVVATGHYSQPRLPSIKGMKGWRGKQMHSHSYREPEPFRGEVVMVVGCGESGKDIAVEVSGVAREVHLVAKFMEEVSPGLSKVLAKHSTNLHLRLHVERLCEDGRSCSATAPASSSTPLSTAQGTITRSRSWTRAEQSPSTTTASARCSSTSSRRRWRRRSPSSAYPGRYSCLGSSRRRPNGWRRCCPAGGHCRQRRRCCGPWRSATAPGRPRACPRSTPTKPACLTARTWMCSGTSTATSLAWSDGSTSCWWRRWRTWWKTSRPSATTTKIATPSARVCRSGTCLHRTKLLLLHKQSIASQNKHSDDLQPSTLCT